MSTQHTHRELLELAAKAVGLRGCASDINPSGAIAFRVMPGDGSFYYWNPLDDDGDALRLAAKLRIDIEWDEQPGGRTVEAYQRAGESYFCATEAEADYRRAIVRAAAAIGKALP